MHSRKAAIDTIIWDADGVLFDTLDEHGRFRWSKTISEDLNIDTEVFVHIFSAGWNEVLRGARDTRRHISEALAAAGSAVAADDYIAYWLKNDVRVNQGTAALLSPSSACIGTNQDPLRAALIARLFAGRIRKLFASSAIGFLKREEGFYRFIETDLNLAPDQLCLIDDTPGNVEAARRFGWTAHHYRGVEPLTSFLAEHGLCRISDE